MPDTNSRYRRKEWPKNRHDQEYSVICPGGGDEEATGESRKGTSGLRQELTKVRSELNTLKKSFTSEHCGIAEQEGAHRQETLLYYE